MSVRREKLGRFFIHGLKLCASLIIIWSLPVHAEVVTDGRVGAVTTLSGDMNIPQSLGRTVGSNLFHSFQTFNINTGESATFTGADSLRNVISRVTGNSISNINGTLTSSIPNANFYLINPNGVIFGSHAQVNVPAAFHVSTADYIKFADGNVFSAINPAASTLTVAEPASFGFLGSSANNNGLIRIDGAKLNVKTSQSLDLVAGNIAVENNAQLFAPAGEVRLVSLQGESAVGLIPEKDGTLPVAMPSNDGGSIVVKNSSIFSTGNGGGKLSLSADLVTLKNSELNANNTGSLNTSISRSLEIQARNLTVDNTHISSEGLGSGLLGNFWVNADSLNILNASYFLSSSSTGNNAENMTVIAGVLKIQGCVYCDSSTGIFSDSKNLTVQAQILNIKNGSIGTNTMDANADKVMVSADQITIDTDMDSYSSGGIFVMAKELTVQAGTLTINEGGEISLTAPAAGASGHMIVNADTLKITGAFGGGIVSQGNDSHDAGTITVNAKNIDLIRGGQIASVGQYDTDYQGGDIIVNADALNLDGQNREDSSTDAHIASYGGTVVVNAKTVRLHDRASISSFDFKASGDVKITADALKIYNNATISSESHYSDFPGSIGGTAGNIVIDTKTLEIFNAGAISSSTNSNYSGGDIHITTDTLKIDGYGTSQYSGQPIFTGIFSVADRDFNLKGNGGTVTVNANAIDIVNGGAISSNTYAGGKAGTITVNAHNLKIDNQNSVVPTGIFSEAYGNILGPGGAAGTITVNADILNMFNGATISSTTYSEGNGGFILLDSSFLTLKNHSKITTLSTTSANAGGITVKGNGVVYLQDSGFTTSVLGIKGDGGNINVAADVLVMNNSVIQANAVSGSGGEINLNLKALIPSQNQLIKGGSQVVWRPFVSGFNVIQAASSTGVSGNVNLTSPQFDISGSISGLTTSGLNMPIISRSPCETFYSGNSLARSSQGGVPVGETKSVFFPPATVLPNPESGFEKNALNTKLLATDSIRQQKNDSCVAEAI